MLLESLTREYHHGSEPPSAVAEEARRGFSMLPFVGSPRTAAPAPASIGAVPEPAVRGSQARPAGLRLHDLIADALDRAIDEAFVAYDRFAAAPRRKSAWRHLIIQFPANIVIRDNEDGRAEERSGRA
jgi:hypothetical protein